VNEERWLEKLSVLKEGLDISVLSIKKAWDKEVAKKGLKKKQIRLKTDPHPSALTHRIWGDLYTPHFTPLMQQACQKD